MPRTNLPILEPRKKKKSDPSDRVYYIYMGHALQCPKVAVTPFNPLPIRRPSRQSPRQPDEEHVLVDLEPGVSHHSRALRLGAAPALSWTNLFRKINSVEPKDRRKTLKKKKRKKKFENGNAATQRIL